MFSTFLALLSFSMIASANHDFLHGQKVTVFVFMSTTCPCSNAHIPVVKELKKKFTKASFRAVIVDPKQLLSQKTLEEALGFEVVMDSQQSLLKEMPAVRTPHAFVWDQNGKLIYSGGISDSSEPKAASELPLKKALTEHFAGQPVSKPRTRTFGCTIERL